MNDNQNKSAADSSIDGYLGYKGAKNIASSLKNNSHTGNTGNINEGIKEAGKEAGKETGKEVGKEAGKEALKTTAEAGAASTGVGAVPVAVEKAATIGVKVADQAATDLSGSKISFKDIALALGLFIFIIMLVYTCGIHGLVGASSEKYHEDQYGKESTFFDFLRNFIYRFFDEGEPGEYMPYEPLLESLEKNCEIFDKAFQRAYELAEKETEAAIVLNDYDYSLTMESFYSNEYPFQDINYAEIISIFTQKDDYNIENLTYKKFKSFFKDDEHIKYLYKIKIEDDYKDVTFWEKPSGEIVRLSEGESTSGEGRTYTETLKYGKVTLVRYDLKSLYEMLELNANEKNIHWESNNIDMLDCQEEYIRYFARDFDLGPKIRSVWDNGFSSGKLSDSEQDYEKIRELIEEENITDLQKYLLESALSKLGTPYSQSFRTSNGYFDCSSFAAWIYSNVGIKFGSAAPTAAEMCRYLDNHNANIGSTSVEDMQVGDLIFYSSKANGRYKSITHVAFYAGNGMIVDASYSKKMVVYRKVWGANQIVAVARPL